MPTTMDIKKVLRDYGFKTLKAPEGVIRMNQLFKPQDGDTITVQIEIRSDAAWASVFRTCYSRSRRGTRQPRVFYLVQGWGNAGNGQDKDFHLAYEVFERPEQIRFLNIVDRAVKLAQKKIAEDNAEHEQWEREKPEGWDTWTRLEQSKYMTARMMERIEAMRAAKENQ